MGLLDSILGAVAGGQAPGAGANPLLEAVVGMLGNNSQIGGLGGLVSRMEQGGLTDVMNSWVSTGHNLPITPEQVQQVLGSGVVQNLAAQLGMNSGDVATHLSQLLPHVVDKLTPDGSVPQGGLGSEVGSMLGQLLGR